MRAASSLGSRPLTLPFSPSPSPAAYLRIGGVDVKNHDVAQEFSALKLIVERIKETEQQQQQQQRQQQQGGGGKGEKEGGAATGAKAKGGAAAGAAGGAQAAPSTAAGRMVAHALGGSTAGKGGGGGGGGGGGETDVLGASGAGTKRPRPKGPASAVPQPDLAHLTWREDMEKQAKKR